jgi:uncharacterized protein (TIGR03083 family)
MTDDPTVTFLGAAESFADLVDGLPADLTGRGLGDWDLRALVGHASRSLITVIDYLAAPPPGSVTLDSAAAYVGLLAEAANGDPGIVARGQQAGAALGDDAPAAVRRLLETVTDRVVAATPDRVVTTFGGGMRLVDYLPTRTFELVVHGFDIAAATGLVFSPAPNALAEAATLAAEVAVRRGEGGRFLRVVTGRDSDPFSIV